MSVKWIKLSVDIFDDEKVKLIRSMPDGDTMTLVWVQLICQAGKCNRDGLVRVAEGITYSDEMLSTVLGHPLSTVRLAINTFAKFGMVHIDDDGIWLTNWEKYQNIDGMARIREQTRVRVARHRTKVKLLPPVTLPVTLRNAPEEEEDTDKDKDIYSTPTTTARTKSNVTPSLSDIARLPSWGESSNNHDSEWMTEFMAEFPSFTVSMLRACRDYHSEKKKHNKGLWKTRLRNWMTREVKGNGNNGGKNTRTIPESYSYVPPQYND